MFTTPRCRPAAFSGLLLCVLALAACGGGGGGEPATPEPPVPAPPVFYAVGGQVSGLGAGKSFVAANVDAGGQALQSATLTQNGAYSLSLGAGTAYDVRVQSQPAGQRCVVANGAGVAAATVTNIAIACDDNRFRVGGTVAGLTGTAVLQLNGGDDTAVAGSGTFTFATPLVEGSSYNITLRGAAAGQACTVANGTGTAMAEVVNVQVTCVVDPVVPPVVPPVVVPPVVVPPPPPPPPPTPVPAVPAGLTVSYDVKSFLFAWSASATTTAYQVLESADGVAPYVAVATVAATTATHAVPVLLHQRLNARYAVQACNAGGCSVPSAFVAPDVNAAIGYFKASTNGSGDGFGASAALSADGRTLAIGAPYEDSNATGIGGNQANNSFVNAGAVYVYVRTGNRWAFQAYVKASNPAANDLFGRKIALSEDGSTLAVSAQNEDSNATGVNGDQSDNSVASAGAVYVFARSGAVWSQQAYVKGPVARSLLFGEAVALSGDGNTLAVGAMNDASNATGVGGDPSNNTAPGSGAVFVFTRVAGAWSQQAYVKASTPNIGDSFGQAVALSTDGSTMVVGAPNEDSNAPGVNGDEANNAAFDAGAAYVFVRTGTVWAKQAYLKASNPGANDYYGLTATISGDGNTVAVGALSESSNGRGVGAVQANDAASSSGAVYVYSRIGAAWTQQAYIKSSNSDPNDNFGRRVVLSADGNTLAASAVNERSASSGIGGDKADNTVATGAVYVFRRAAGAWNETGYLKARLSRGGNSFGLNMGISADGNTLAIGAESENSDASGINGDFTNINSVASGAVMLY